MAQQLEAALYSGPGRSETGQAYRSALRTLLPALRAADDDGVAARLQAGQLTAEQVWTALCGASAWLLPGLWAPELWWCCGNFYPTYLCVLNAILAGPLTTTVAISACGQMSVGRDKVICSTFRVK